MPDDLQNSTPLTMPPPGPTKGFHDVDSLAALVKSKYPDYASWDNNKLVDGLIQKHPEYQTWLSDDTLRQLASRGAPTFGSTVKDIAGNINESMSQGLGRNAGEMWQSAKKGARNLLSMVGPNATRDPITAATDWIGNKIDEQYGPHGAVAQYSPETDLGKRALAAIPLVGPAAAGIVGDVEKRQYANAALNTGRGILQGATAAEIPGAVKDAVPRVRQFIENRRVLTGTELAKKGLNIPAAPEAAALAGRTAPDAVNLAADFDRARPYLAEIERTNPVGGKGSAATFQRAKNTLDYADQMWETSHNEPIARQAHLPIDSQSVAQAGMDAMTPEAVAADPRGPALQRRLQNWLQETISQPRNLQSADGMVRELNADLNSARANQSYGPLDMRVRQAVVKAYRNRIDRVLTDAGEQGVKESNQDWGAVNNIGQEMLKSGVNEAKTEGRAGIIPDWAHAYLFRHFGAEGMPSIGVSVNPASLFRPNPSSQLASGMGKLGRSQLTPPTTAAPPIVSSAEDINRVARQTPQSPPPVMPKFVQEGTGVVQDPSQLGPRGRSAMRVNVLPTEHPGEGNYAGLLPGPPSPFEPPAPMPPVPQVGNPPTLGFPPVMPNTMWTPRMTPFAPTWDLPDTNQPVTTPSGAMNRRLLLTRPLFPQGQ